MRCATVATIDMGQEESGLLCRVGPLAHIVVNSKSTTIIFLFPIILLQELIHIKYYVKYSSTVEARPDFGCVGAVKPQSTKSIGVNLNLQILTKISFKNF